MEKLEETFEVCFVAAQGKLSRDINYIFSFEQNSDDQKEKGDFSWEKNLKWGNVNAGLKWFSWDSNPETLKPFS